MAYKSYMHHTSHARLLFPGALALALLFLACDMLPVNEFEPTGTQFNINTDIHVISITGNPQTSPSGPMTMGMTIVSRTSSVESDVLPAGLLLKRRVNNTQHMLLLKPHAIVAGTTNSVAILGTFCCNENRPSPDLGDTFDIGPVTDNAELKQIADLVEGKDISKGTDMWMVQHAVYMVTNGDSLTQAYIDSLIALPPEPTD